jgi:hypothetical protein
MHRTTSQSDAIQVSNSSQLTLDRFVKKQPHPASIMADMKSNKRWTPSNGGGYIISLLLAFQKDPGISALIPKG